MSQNRWIQKYYDRVDQNEIDDMLADDDKEANPIVTTVDEDEDEQNDDDQLVDDEKEDDEDDEADEDSEDRQVETETTDDETTSDATAARRSTREVREPIRLEPTFQGKSHAQTEAKVTFAESKTTRLEYCHNLVMQSHRDTSEDYDYTGTEAIVVAQCIVEMNKKSKTQGVSFIQQYLLHKGLKLFGDRGREATKAEIEQLHERECFTPMSIAKISLIEKNGLWKL